MTDGHLMINIGQLGFGTVLCFLPLVGSDKERTRKNVRKMDYKT